MAQAWIQLLCPNCGEDWEESPSDLPAPGGEYDCDHCDTRRPVAEFMRTPRDLEILEEFHAG